MLQARSNLARLGTLVPPPSAGSKSLFKSTPDAPHPGSHASPAGLAKSRERK